MGIGSVPPLQTFDSSILLEALKEVISDLTACPAEFDGIITGIHSDKNFESYLPSDIQLLRLLLHWYYDKNNSEGFAKIHYIA